MAPRIKKPKPVHTEREKQLMAKGKPARAKDAARRERQREIDLLDTSVGHGGTDDPSVPPAPAKPAPTHNQAFYRSLVKQLAIKRLMIEHWAQIQSEHSDELHTSAIHAKVQGDTVKTEAATWERRIAELLREDPDADK